MTIDASRFEKTLLQSSRRMKDSEILCNRVRCTQKRHTTAKPAIKISHKVTKEGSYLRVELLPVLPTGCAYGAAGRYFNGVNLRFSLEM